MESENSASTVQLMPADTMRTSGRWLRMSAAKFNRRTGNDIGI